MDSHYHKHHEHDEVEMDEEAAYGEEQMSRKDAQKIGDRIIEEHGQFVMTDSELFY